MTKTTDWFAVDKEGLAQILERRGKSFAVLELVSNAWDQAVTAVDIKLVPTGKRARYLLTVTDDDPDGFSDLTHAYTLFAPSEKKGAAEKRGRFNLGEKLVLAMCDEATITSTTGGVSFDGTGRANVKTHRQFGSEFSGVVRMTKPEFEETCAVIMTLIPPRDVKTVFNGTTLAVRNPYVSFDATLPTEIADAEGNVKPSSRKTTVTLYVPEPGETAMIYEMGIPVVENGDTWHYDIAMKVPLNMDRDNVKPAYLRTLRTLVLNETYQVITADDANATWAKEAIEDPRVDPEAVKSVIEKRFGDKAVIFDPSDHEANRIATAQGFTVIAPRTFSKEAWTNIRAAEILKPAGQVTPSPSAVASGMFSPTGTKVIEVDPAKWTAGQKLIVEYAEEVGRFLLGFEPTVRIASDITLPLAAYWHERTLTFNVGKLGHAWFDTPVPPTVDELLLHEFAHHRGNHLDDHAFHHELCRLGVLLRDCPTRLNAQELMKQALMNRRAQLV